MNRNSYPATFRNSADECVGIGDFIYSAERDYIYIVLPRADGKFSIDTAGRAALDPIRIERTASANPRIWYWDGNEAKPTLTPSIDWPGHWHGYLTKGELKSC